MNPIKPSDDVLVTTGVKKKAEKRKILEQGTIKLEPNPELVELAKRLRMDQNEGNEVKTTLAKLSDIKRDSTESKGEERATKRQKKDTGVMEIGVCSEEKGKATSSKKSQNPPVRRTQHMRQCPHCLKDFRSPSGLKAHIVMHTNEKPFACKHCDKKYKYYGGLSQHVLDKHTENYILELPYKCDTCGKRFSKPSLLKDHLPIHHDYKPFKCDKCGKFFKREKNMKYHQKVHGERTVECDLCGKMFKTRPNMKFHRLTHAKEKTFKCGMCPKMFRTKSHRNKHENRHADACREICESCGRVFVTKEGLKNHLLKHLNG